MKLTKRERRVLSNFLEVEYDIRRTRIRDDEGYPEDREEMDVINKLSGMV